jgi:FkbM family methyltransferase
MKIRDIDITLFPDEALSNHIRREKDFFEADILDYLRDHHPEQKVIVDAGANIGNHAVYFANFLKYQSLYCFEPVPENFELLAQNLSFPHTHLYQKALSDKNTTLKIAPNTSNMGACKVDGRGSLEVKAITLDSLALQNVTLLKIDVENHEPAVLAGAKDTINRCHPLILIEDWKQTYKKLLPDDYELEKSWPKYRTYLYKWAGKKPYLLSIYSYTPGVDNHNQSLGKLEGSVEQVNVELKLYPGHLFRWDAIPKELDRDRVFIFTDTADVIFQKPIPALSPDYIYVANEGEIFKNNRFWRAIFRRYPQFNVLNDETIYNVGSFACSGKIMDTWVAYLQAERPKARAMVTEQLLFNLWLRQPKNISMLREIPDLFTSLYANMEKGITIVNEKNQFVNKNGELYAVVHYNGNMKQLMK